MHRIVLPCLVAFLGVLISGEPAGAAERGQTPGAATGYVPGELLVRFKPGVSGRERAAARRKQHANVEDVLEVPRVQLVEIEPGTSVRDAVAAFERDPRVEYAEPNYRVSASAVPNDPQFAQLWSLDSLGDIDIDAPEAWDIRTSSGVTVAVVDTGVALNHPDLAGNLVQGRDFVHDDDAPGDLDGHGTHVAGTIGALGNNGVGVTGVAWDVNLMPLRVLGNDGSGTFADVASAFAYAGAHGARVVNASLGGSPDPAEIDTLEAAVEGAPQTVFVVAAGNDTLNVDQAANAEYPCELPQPNVVCVAASNESDARASFSNWGLTSVDLAAPGTSIRSTKPAVSLRFQELFETDLDAWTEGSGPDDNQPTGWDRSNAAADSSEGSWGLVDSVGGDYPNNSDTWIRTTNPVSVPSDCSLWFDFRLDVGNGDRFSVEASESATGPWTEIYGRGTDTTSGHLDFDPDGDGFWTVFPDLRSDDGSYDFYDSDTYIRFRMKSDAVSFGPGVAVDWVEVLCHGGEQYGAMNGTSMATPYVSGAAALLLAQEPGLGAPDVKSVLMTTGDPISWGSESIVSGRRLNLARALQESTAGGSGDGASPPPAPPAAPAPQPAPPPTGANTPTPAPLDITAPVITASAARRYRTASLLRRGLRARIACDEACSLRTDVLIGRRTAKKLGITGRRFGRGYILVGRKRAALSDAGSRVVTTRIMRGAYRGLRRARSVRLVLRVLASDGRGNDRVTRRTLTVRR